MTLAKELAKVAATVTLVKRRGDINDKVAVLSDGNGRKGSHGRGNRRKAMELNFQASIQPQPKY